MSAECNAVGCAAARGSGLMCRSCWFSVPLQLRRQVNATWRTFTSRTRPAGVYRDSAYLDYIEARDEAIRFVAEGAGRLDQFEPDLPRIRALQELRS